MEIRANTPSDAWWLTLEALASAPTVNARDLKASEISERVSIIVERPSELVYNPGRKFNHAISVLEGLSLVGQCSVPEWQTSRVAALGAFQNGSVFRGSYGPRVEGSLDDVIRLLESDPDSRQAVITMYDGQRDLGRWNDTSKSGDVPCTLAIQFLIRPSRFETPLHMWVTMRSNDAWRGLPYDMGQFMILQHAVAQALGVPVGTYTHSAGSMHIYEEHWAAAGACLAPGKVPFEAKEFKYGGRIFGFTEIASRARRMLWGKPLEDTTEFEKYAIGKLA